MPACLLVAFLLSACRREPTSAAPIAATPSPAPAAATVALASPPAAPGALAAHLSSGRAGLWLSWLEPTGDGHRLLVSHLGRDRRWSSPVEVAQGAGFFANWADLPGVAEAADGTLVAHWLEKLGDSTYAYGVQLARSRDGGRSWQRIGLLHPDDDSPTEHGFVSWAPGAAGLRAFWLDGRAMAREEPMQLRSAELGPTGPPTASELLDARVCECCDTAAAATSGGPLVVYRDRSEDEQRDFALVRRGASGWSAPALVHADRWQIEGCPVNGAAVAVTGDGVAAAWFTGAADTPAVRVAFSTDGGATFGAPVAVGGARPLGRVGIAPAREDGVWVSWLELVDGAAAGAQLRLQRFTPAGAVGSPLVVAGTSGGRNAGVPQIQRLGGELVVVWLEVGKPGRLRARAVPA